MYSMYKCAFYVQTEHFMYSTYNSCTAPFNSALTLIQHHINCPLLLFTTIHYYYIK